MLNRDRSASAARALARLVVLALLVMPLGGCSWFLNETFVYDAPPPVPELTTGVDAAW